MSSVINTNMMAVRTGNIYNKNTNAMATAMNRVSTGMKINSAKDNASTWAITEKMRERIRANDQANQNIQNDSALLRTAQDGFGNTLDILKTIKERAINSANDSNISSDRTKIVEEVKQLVAQIDDNAAKVKFNGRALLNGGVEAAGATSSTSKVGTVAAEKVAADGPYGANALYGITGLNNKDSTTAVSSTSKLVELVDNKGNTLFHAGDKITFKWTENGEAKEKSYDVTSASKLTDLSIGSFTAAYTKASSDTAVDYLDGGESKDFKAAEAGLYFTGTANKVITDFSISVTASTGETRVNAQEAFKPDAFVQSYGDNSKGPHEVWNTGKTLQANHTADGDQTTLAALGVATNDKTDVKIKVNDTTLSFTGSTTLEEVNRAFKENNVDVEFHYAVNEKDPLTYDGKTVTMGTYGSEATANVSAAGLNVVGGEGFDIKKLAFGGTDVAAATNQKIKLDTNIASDSTPKSTEASLLPQGEALQFFVGGEQNFGVNFTIGTATNKTLFGMTGDEFAAKFANKDDAEEAIGMIDDAISKVLVEQTRLGAMEARMGYTSDNITTMNENLEAGFSAYRDSDIAKEMTSYMKNAVLSQAAQYMLSQSNQNAFQVLSFLQA